MWECPDFFPLNGKQALLASAHAMRGGGEFHPGHGAMLIIGSYDSDHSCFRRESIQPLDEGLDFYAPQTVLTPDGRRVMIAWMDNWQYAKRTPRIHPWYGQMTMPRELALENGRLTQRPVREIESLWQNTIQYENVRIQEKTVLPGVRGRMLDVTLTLRPESAASRLTLLIAQDADHEVSLQYDPAHEELLLDRSRDGSRLDIAHIRRIKTGLRDGQFSLRLLFDWESVEIFVNGGEKVLTAVLFAPPQADGLVFSADAPWLLTAEAHHLG